MTDKSKKDFIKRLEGTHLTDADHDEIVLEISSTIRTISGICYMSIPDDVKIQRILEMIDYANGILKDASYNERYLRALENWEKGNND